MIDKSRMAEKAAGMQINLTQEQLDALDRYASLLVEWNAKMNLTAITQPEEIEVKHFLDCLLLAAQPEVKGSLVDVGSGAGFPGVVVKLYRPDINLTMVEPTGKRVQFLSALLSALHLEGLPIQTRAEEMSRGEKREFFDVAVARAVASMSALSEYCLPLVRCGGYFIAMKGADEEEVHQAEKAITELGGKLEEIRTFHLPDGATRQLVVVHKVKDTPQRYPRATAAIKKRPL